MHDFFCTDPDDMHYKELADKVRYFKEDEKGVAAMCKVMEDMRNEAAKNAVEKAMTSMRNSATLAQHSTAQHRLTAPFLRLAGRLKLNTTFVMDNRGILSG